MNGTQLYCEIKPPYDYTLSDLVTLQKYLRGEITLPEEELDKYDVTGDGKIDGQDLLRMQKLIWYNLTNSNPGKLIFDTNDWFNPIKIVNSSGVVLASFGVHGVSTIDDK